MAAQIAVAIIFVIMFAMIIMEKIERHYVTLLSAGVTIIVVFGIIMRSFSAFWNTMALEQIFTTEFWYSAGHVAGESGGINWATIIFLLGMMIMVEGLGHVGFFRWLCVSLIKLVRHRVTPIFISFMVMSAILAMFIDSITVILFLAAITVEVAKEFNFDPVSLIIPEIFFANLGGAATMSGDPPNIIIGTSLGYSFMDFVTHTGVIVLISLVVCVFYYYLISRKTLRQVQASQTGEVIMESPSEVIKSLPKFIINILIFLFAIVLLVTHAMTGLSVATIGVVVSVLTIIFNISDLKAIFKGVDYKTLLFFLGLFVVVGAMEQTGVLELVSDLISTVCGGNAVVMVVVIVLFSAVASAIIDNIPFAATMVPVIVFLSIDTGVDLHILAYSLAIGTDIGGAATPIGASANVVGISIASKAGYPIGWGRYCKTSIPPTLITLGIAILIIVFRYL